MREDLRERIEALARGARQAFTPADRELFGEFREALNRGDVRAAERAPDGAWRVNAWVKRGILLGFRMGALVDMSANGALRFFDKDTLPLRKLSVSDGVRVVPGGTSIRDGAYVAPGVVCMPPTFVNVGAWVGEGTLLDSHALVGSCAQVGRRVHLSAAAQVGGVLEPVAALPVIIEDDVLVGGGCGLYEGTIVRERAVLAPGTIITGSTPVYDLVHGRVLRRPADGALEIPAGAVVVPGSRAVSGGPEGAADWKLSLYTPVIVKYRDAKTDAAVLLEEVLR